MIRNFKPWSSGCGFFFNFFQKYRLRYKNNVYFCIVNDII